MMKVPAIRVKMDIKSKLAVVILFSAIVSLCLIIVVHKQKRNEAIQSEAVLNSEKDGKNVKEMFIDKDKNVFKQEQFKKGEERKEVMDQEDDPHVERREGKEDGEIGEEVIYYDKIEENEDEKISDKKDKNGEEEDEDGEELNDDLDNKKYHENEVNVGEDNKYYDKEEDNDGGKIEDEEENEEGEKEDGQFEDFHDAEKYFKHANLQVVEEEEDDGELEEDDPEDGEEHEAFGEENVDEDDGEPNAPNELFDDGEDEEDKPIDVKKGNKNIEDFKRDDIIVVEKEENGLVHEIEVDDGGVKNVDNNVNGGNDFNDGGNNGDLVIERKYDSDDDRDDGNDENGNAGDVDDKDDDENDNEDDDGIGEVETDIEHKIVHDET